MKKFISGLLAVILIVSVLTVSAADSPRFVQVTASAADRTVTLSLQAMEKTTNGRFIIHYDPAVLEFEETALPDAVYYCKEAENGTVHLAYAQKKAIAAGETLAALRFAFLGELAPTEFSVTLEDFNHRESMHLELGTVKVNAEVPFTDVTPADWFYDSVRDAYQAGWVSGTSDALFEPYGTMNRAMFVTILGRMAGISAAAPEKTAFTDVDVDDYYAPYVQWAAENGIVKGMTREHFCPKALVTRQQIITFLYRYAAVLELDTTASSGALDRFADARQVSDYAQDAMAWAIEQELIRGADGRLNPHAAADRAQGTAFLVRFSRMD